MVRTHQVDGGRERGIETFSNPAGEDVEVYTLDAQGNQVLHDKPTGGVQAQTEAQTEAPTLGHHEHTYRGLDREGHLYFSVLHRHWNRLDSYRYGYLSGWVLCDRS